MGERRKKVPKCEPLFKIFFLTIALDTHRVKFYVVPEQIMDAAHACVMWKQYERTHVLFTGVCVCFRFRRRRDDLLNGDGRLHKSRHRQSSRGPRSDDAADCVNEPRIFRSDALEEGGDRTRADTVNEDQNILITIPPKSESNSYIIIRMI